MVRNDENEWFKQYDYDDQWFDIKEYDREMIYMTSDMTQECTDVN